MRHVWLKQFFYCTHRCINTLFVEKSTEILTEAVWFLCWWSATSTLYDLVDTSLYFGAVKLNRENTC